MSAKLSGQVAARVIDVLSADVSNERGQFHRTRDRIELEELVKAGEELVFTVVDAPSQRFMSRLAQAKAWLKYR